MLPVAAGVRPLRSVWSALHSVDSHRCCTALRKLLACIACMQGSSPVWAIPSLPPIGDGVSRCCGVRVVSELVWVSSLTHTVGKQKIVVAGNMQHGGASG